MSSISVNTITDASGGTTTSINGYTPTVSNMAGRNRIINGGMVLDQRNAGAAVTFNDATFPVDRFKGHCTQSSKFTAQQSTASPVGFTNSVQITSTSAYSVGAGDFFVFAQNIEGHNLADLGWGTLDAQAVTISFWVRSSLTGTFGACFKNGGSSRAYPFTYTISSANTWEKKVVVVAGETNGTWLSDNGVGLRVLFGLGAGATYSGAAGAWSSNNYWAATGATAVVGTSGATFYITGVQLEAGSVATPFEHRQYGQELALCQRYFFRYSTTTGFGPYGTGHGVNTTLARFMVKTPQTMRAQPSLGFSAASGFLVGWLNALSGIVTAEFGVDSFSVDGTSTGLTAFGGYMLTSNANTTSFITASAEL